VPGEAATDAAYRDVGRDILLGAARGMSSG